MKGILLVSQAVSCQHTGLGGLGERHLRDFPGCRLPTYKAKRVGVKGILMVSQALCATYRRTRVG